MYTFCEVEKRRLGCHTRALAWAWAWVWLVLPFMNSKQRINGCAFIAPLLHLSVQVHPPSSWRSLYKRASTPLPRISDLAQVFLFRRPLPSPSAFCCCAHTAFPSLVPARAGLARAGLRNLRWLSIVERLHLGGCCTSTSW